MRPSGFPSGVYRRAGHSSGALTVCSYNTHLFGALAGIGGAGTVFNLDDERRAAAIARELPGTGADVVCLQEVWDARLAERIIGETGYPCHAGSPYGAGFDGIIDRVKKRSPSIADLLSKYGVRVTESLFDLHYPPDSPLLQGALLAGGVEDRIGRLLQNFFPELNVYGAGLLILSRYPIEDVQFYPHPVRADWERLAGKGVLGATIRSGEDQPISVFNTHLQEGVSRTAREARRQQVRHLKELADASPDPVILAGDFNCEGEEEYREVIANLHPRADAWRLLYPDPRTDPGWTWRGDTSFRNGRSEKQKRLDFVMPGPGLRPAFCKIPGNFVDSSRPLSDHLPVVCCLSLEEFLEFSRKSATSLTD